MNNNAGKDNIAGRAASMDTGDFSVQYEKLPPAGRPVHDTPYTVGGAGSAAQGAGSRRLLATRADFRVAVDEIVGVVRRELRIFDPDLADYGFNTPAMEERMQNFLLGARTNRLLIAVHDTTYITQSCPRLLRLLRQFSHSIFIHQTDESIRNLEDVLVVADDAHYLRRPHRDHPKGVIILNDAAETRGWFNRFEEIWEASAPAVSATTLGL
jgi:hypothetical protein